MKTKKTFRLKNELDVNPAHYGFANFTDFANAAISNFIDEKSTFADEANDVAEEISKKIIYFQALRDYPQDEKSWTAEQDEFLDTLNLIYELLIRTDVILNNTKLHVLINDPVMLEFDEKPHTQHRHAYNTTDEELFKSLTEKI